MENKIFVALGGGQESGACAYFLHIDDKYFLFDCGKGLENGVLAGPSFGTILVPPFLTSLSQIDNVFISHGHFDHIGCLPDFAAQCTGTPILATEMTKQLLKYFMWDAVQKSWDEISSQGKITMDNKFLNALNRIHSVPYFQRMAFNDYYVTFFEAGHIPGAAMVFVETDSGSVLYTGDFSVNPTPLAKGCIIPSGIKPDTVILCGMYAKYVDYSPVSRIMRRLQPAGEILKTHEPVYLTVKQLTKGLELLQIVDRLIENGQFPHVDIYIDDNMWELSQLLGMALLNKRCRRFPRSLAWPDYGLYIGSGYGNYHFKHVTGVDFSLHAVYNEIKGFISTLEPKNVIVVHMDTPEHNDNKCDLSIDFPEINFIYAQNRRTYLL